MAKYKIAHIREQGIDLIIAPLDSSFEYRTSQEQQEFISALQICASSTGLAGAVIPIWQYGNTAIALGSSHPLTGIPSSKAQESTKGSSPVSTRSLRVDKK